MSTSRDVISKWVAEAAALGDVDSYSAKRSAKRFACHWNVQMKVGHAVHLVNIRDVSDHGVGVISPVEVGAGRTIELRREDAEPWVAVRVMHSTLTVGRYKLGAIIQFEGDGSRQLRGDETPQLAESLLAMAKLKLSRGDAAAAEMLIRECLEIRENALGATHWLTAIAKSLLGECLIILGRHAGAESLLVDSYPDIEAGLGGDDDRTRAALTRIIYLYETWGQPEKADEYRERAS